MANPLSNKGTVLNPVRPGAFNKTALVPGSELALATISGDVTQNTPSTYAAVVTTGSFFCDGSKLRYEFVAAEVFTTGAGTPSILLVFAVDGVKLTSVAHARWTPGGALDVPAHVVCYHTPAAGMHTVSLQCWYNSVTSITFTGSGGYAPAFLRVTKA